jgi:hypothetical protein
MIVSNAVCVTVAFRFSTFSAHEPYRYLLFVWSHNAIGHYLINVKIKLK